MASSLLNILVGTTTGYSLVPVFRLHQCSEEDAKKLVKYSNYCANAEDETAGCSDEEFYTLFYTEEFDASGNPSYELTGQPIDVPLVEFLTTFPLGELDNIIFVAEAC